MIHDINSVEFTDVGKVSTDPFRDLAQPNRNAGIDSYVREGTYNGVMVADECKNRMIPKDTDLSTIFTPSNNVSVHCLEIYPGSRDIQTYADIMQAVHDGDSFLESVDKHPTDKGFVVMLVVNKLRMKFSNDKYKEIFPVINIGGNDGE